MIDALKIGTGTYLKLVNDYTSFKDVQTLNYIICFVSRYKDTNTMLFFRSQQNDCGVLEFSDFNSFLKNISYINTSAPCFGIYRSQFIELIESNISLNRWFPHVSLMYNQYTSNFVVVYKNIYESPRIEKKGGYNIPMVFGKEYIEMNDCLCKARRITQEVFDFLRLETLGFIADWYSKSKYDKKHCAFDFTDTKKWLSYYYTEGEIQRFYKIVKKYNISRVFCKLFYLPLKFAHLLLHKKAIQRIRRIICMRGGVRKYSELTRNFAELVKEAA